MLPRAIEMITELIQGKGLEQYPNHCKIHHILPQPIIIIIFMYLSKFLYIKSLFFYSLFYKSG